MSHRVFEHEPRAKATRTHARARCGRALWTRNESRAARAAATAMRCGRRARASWQISTPSLAAFFALLRANPQTRRSILAKTTKFDAILIAKRSRAPPPRRIVNTRRKRDDRAAARLADHPTGRRCCRLQKQAPHAAARLARARSLASAGGRRPQRKKSERREESDGLWRENKAACLQFVVAVRRQKAHKCDDNRRSVFGAQHSAIAVRNVLRRKLAIELSACLSGVAGKKIFTSTIRRRSSDRPSDKSPEHKFPLAS